MLSVTVVYQAFLFLNHHIGSRIVDVG